jgi:hypothetical protein
LIALPEAVAVAVVATEVTVLLVVAAEIVVLPDPLLTVLLLSTWMMSRLSPRCLNQLSVSL